MNKPFFSIVLPTRNKADFLPHSIRSVLNQTFSDFELIVSNNNSSDGTEEIVAKFTDSRIRYFNTGADFHIGDSWEFALDQAQGEYITFLGDDDAHSVIYLESLKRKIDEFKNLKIISCQMAQYFYQSPANSTTPSLKIEKFDNKLTEYEPKKLLYSLFSKLGLTSQFSFYREVPIPQLINTVYHKSVFEQIKNSFGKVFPKVLSGDYYLAAICFGLTDNFYFLNSPLSFHGISQSTTTSSITNRKKGKKLKDVQPDIDQFSEVPLPISTPYNFSADAVLIANRLLADNLRIETEFAGYYLKLYDELRMNRFTENDASEDLQEFNRHIRSLEPETRNKVLNYVNQNKLGDFFRSRLYTTSLYQYLSRIKNKSRYKHIEFSGDKFNFADIAECAELVNEDFLKNYASGIMDD